MDLFEASVDKHAVSPLPERMRPRTPDEFVGQAHLMGPGKALRMILDKGVLTSFVMWGPPGTGKTTVARMAAVHADAEFIELSAVSDGIPRIREVVKSAKDALHMHSRRSVVFVDEIHRWNTTAQDAVLPHVESGLFTLIGATTENVSFELRAALLSRVRVYRLEPLTDDDVRESVVLALNDSERGLRDMELDVEAEALDLIVKAADGDIRKALGTLELAARIVGQGGTITTDLASEATGLTVVRHDRAGDGHYDISSALIKSIRGSDPQAALYWLARLLVGGDVKMVIRRLLISAAEDIGLANPQGIVVAEAAGRAFDRVGRPEGDIILAQAVNYLATSPKSNRSYQSIKAAHQAVLERPSAPVPEHLRGSDTRSDEKQGGTPGYENPFNNPDHFSRQAYLPEELSGVAFYRPSGFGHEGAITNFMAEIQALRQGKGHTRGDRHSKE